MTSSLVGSEMCIRDSFKHPREFQAKTMGGLLAGEQGANPCTVSPRTERHLWSCVALDTVLF
eukprot:7606216-Prorocentrum_lima.AAC.1